MTSARFRIARDYNQGLSASVRLLHVVCGIVFVFVGPFWKVIVAYWRWASAPGRAWWLRPISVGVVVALAFVPFDGAISDSLAQFRRGGKHQLGGDVLLTLNTLGQFGDLATTLVAAWAFFLVAPDRRRKLLDWALAIVMAMVVANVLKLGLGRPRPALGEPLRFLGVWNAYPLDSGDPGVGDVLTYPWQFWQRGAARLWSMPSSHTMAAVAMAMVLSRLVPKLRPMVFTCAAFVGFNRVLIGMHYPSDVVVGATLAIVCVRWTFDHRLVDRMRWALVPRQKRPIAPRAGKLPALANAIRVQRGEEARPEQADSSVLPSPSAPHSPSPPPQGG